jgi:hypothetical protein
MSVRTLTSIGQLSLGVDSVILVTPNRLAGTVLSALGFSDVTCVDTSRLGGSSRRLTSPRPHERCEAKATTPDPDRQRPARQSPGDARYP